MYREMKGLFPGFWKFGRAGPGVRARAFASCPPLDLGNGLQQRLDGAHLACGRLNAVTLTARSAVDTAHRLLDLFREDGARLGSLGRSASTALRVFDAFHGRPLSTIPALVDRTQASFPTVARAIDALTAAGIVKEITGCKRERLFACRRHLDILNEGTAPR